MTDTQNSACVPVGVIEQARRLYRGLEMSAGIMRDTRRTGGWEGAERTAAAFERYAEAAKGLHARITALEAHIAAEPDRMREVVERCAKVAETVGDPLRDDDYSVGEYLASQAIAAALRALAAQGGKSS